MSISWSQILDTRYFYHFCRQGMGRMSPDSRPFKNSNLFSNHYLEKLIKDEPGVAGGRGPSRLSPGSKSFMRRRRGSWRTTTNPSWRRTSSGRCCGCWGTTSECRERCWERTGRRTTPSTRTRRAWMRQRRGQERITTAALWPWAMPSPGRSRWTRAARDRAASRC